MKGTVAFSAISPTRLVTPPKRVVRVAGPEDVTEEGVPRYDYFRGVEGEVILDMTDMKGVEDLGDRVKVLAGTPWSEVLKYPVETFGLAEASVGGSVAYGDPGFGFNEFGPVSRKVEVEAVLGGKTYVGEYRGGVILSVTIRKDSKPLEYRKLEREFDFLLQKVRYWFSYSLPPFRDVTVVKDGEKATLLVAYPKMRETLLSERLEGTERALPYSFELGNYKFRYFGELRTESLSGNQFPKAERIYLFVRRDVTRFVILSNVPLDFPPETNLTSYSDVGRNNLFQDCILCGRCVNVCPHGQQRGDKDYTPLGFFVASALGAEDEYANCHMCGKCDEVCPAKLNIVERLKKKAKLRSLGVDVQLNFPSKKVVLVTPISQNLRDELLTFLNVAHSLGLKLGVLTLDVTLDKLVKGEVELSLPEGVEQIYTLTPEEAYYLVQLKTKRLVDIGFVFDELPESLKKEVRFKRVHKPCFYRGKINGEEKCSFTLLELVNGEPSSSQSIRAEVTLCPLASKKLGIPSYLDLISTQDASGDRGSRIRDDILKLVREKETVLKDMEWYSGLDDDIAEDYVRGLVRRVLEDAKVGDLISLYFNLRDLLGGSGEELLFRVIEEEIRNVISS